MPRNYLLERAMASDPERELWTVSRASEESGRPRSTIYRWISEGRLGVVYRSGPRPLYVEADAVRNLTEIQPVHTEIRT